MVEDGGGHTLMLFSENLDKVDFVFASASGFLEMGWHGTDRAILLWAGMPPLNWHGKSWNGAWPVERPWIWIWIGINDHVRYAMLI